MGSKISNRIGGLLIASFILWYLLRQTTLGAAYSADMMSIPQGLSEGLRSAQTTFVR